MGSLIIISAFDYNKYLQRAKNQIPILDIGKANFMGYPNLPSLAPKPLLKIIRCGGWRMSISSIGRRSKMELT